LQGNRPFVELGLEAGDGLARAADLGQLGGGLGLHLLHAGLETARCHRDLRVQLAHVGFDVGHQPGSG